MAQGGEGRKRGGKGGPAPRPAAPPAEAASGTVAAHEPLVFPADTEPSERRGRIELPASGLAADILALADAAAVPAAPPPARASAPDLLPVVSEPAPRAHNISFFAAPVREERKAAEATEHLATFFLAGEEYGVDVRVVQEIIRVAEITQVPRAPDFIKGVINLRGRIIPVIDLKRKLGLGEVEVTRQSRIVVVKIKERLLGLLVDGASQVLKVPVSSIEAAPEEVTEVDATAVRGVAKLPGRLIILMDLGRTLSLELRDQDGEAE
jgi:purine-binding chemotaxis protein CheW